MARNTKLINVNKLDLEWLRQRFPNKSDSERVGSLTKKMKQIEEMIR